MILKSTKYDRFIT